MWQSPKTQQRGGRRGGCPSRPAVAESSSALSNPRTVHPAPSFRVKIVKRLKKLLLTYSGDLSSAIQTCANLYLLALPLCVRTLYLRVARPSWAGNQPPKGMSGSQSMQDRSEPGGVGLAAARHGQAEEGSARDRTPPRMSESGTWGTGW